MAVDPKTDTSGIKEWRSIFTLIVFVLANIVVIFPLQIPIPLPRVFCDAILKFLAVLRIIPHRKEGQRDVALEIDGEKKNHQRKSALKWFQFPVNFVTGPLIADLFLLIIGAIGRTEVQDGIVGTDNIKPYDILLFFFTLAYIAISIDASGLIRYLAFRVLLWGGKIGHRLFFFLYLFWLGLGSFIGNDPIILSGTAFLAYMTRVSSNIVHPRAWIHTQFAVANTASAILVSSNPTNLVLAGAFKISFIDYTRDDEKLIPENIQMHELDEEEKNKKPVNPNIPYGRGTAGEEEKRLAGTDESQLLSLVEIMNPFLDKTGAFVGGVVMAATLVTILVLNAKSTNGQNTPIFYVTLPAAVVVLAFDLTWGWTNRKSTRKIAQDGRKQVAEAAERQRRETNAEGGIPMSDTEPVSAFSESASQFQRGDLDEKSNRLSSSNPDLDEERRSRSLSRNQNDTIAKTASKDKENVPSKNNGVHEEDIQATVVGTKADMGIGRKVGSETPKADQQAVAANLNTPPATKSNEPTTLVSMAEDLYRWTQDTFPTVVAVLSHLPYALLPFAFEMFILVQGLVTKGWVPVFAYGWNHWVTKTGTVGAIGGMGFLSVILCNFCGTNISATILLTRVIQSWLQIHMDNGIMVDNKTRVGTIYAMALGVNYGAYSITFSASLAGLLWRDILSRKHIRVTALEFARVNLPIISFAMTVGSAILVGEVYLFK
ncbi:hypothetical protein F5Y16DRAFT_400232 [Xylariaceae sp. FL0255]|nr:hypothetical protein F5Y16DRAFT_400232 [Xylariaceae sp. FL0255]